jgi:hypothetical protein
MPIIGVPKKNDEWDVSWLGSNAAESVLLAI